MGWNAGSGLFKQVMSAIRPEIADEARRKAVYICLIPAFEDRDWDTQMECLGVDPAYDAALLQLRPDLFEEE